VPRGKTPVFVNMDETSISVTYGGQKGNIRVLKKQGGFRQRFVERLSPGERRQTVSLLVSLANVYEVHKELPHIFLGSAKHFTGTFLGTYRPQMPTNIYLWANERGWMTQDTCAVLLRAINASLGDLTSRYHVILLMDAHRAHINETICRRAMAMNMFLLYVPARLTWLLQPADTHLFAPFKSSIRRTYTNRRLAAHDGRSAGRMARCGMRSTAGHSHESAVETRIRKQWHHGPSRRRLDVCTRNGRLV